MSEFMLREYDWSPQKTMRHILFDFHFMSMHMRTNIPNHVWEVYIPFIGPTNPISVRFCFMLLFHMSSSIPQDQ